MVAAPVDVVWWTAAAIGLLWLAVVAVALCMLLSAWLRPWSAFVLFCVACIAVAAVFG